MSLRPFELLGVDCKSSREEVRRSFKDLSLVCHPDKGGDEEQMKMLYMAYKFVLEQIEFQEHGRTMEEEEENFKKFLEGQIICKLPSIFEIMTEESNKLFNLKWEEDKGEVIDMCYPSNYGEKMKNEPEKFSTEIIEYKEPKTIGELSFSSILDFTVNPVKDFTDYTGGGGYDYVLAHSIEKLDNIIEEKDVMTEYELMLKRRKEQDEIEIKKEVKIFK